MIITIIISVTAGYILARCEIIQRLLSKFRYPTYRNNCADDDPADIDLDLKLERILKLTEVPEREKDDDEISFPNHLTYDFDNDDD